MDPKDVHALRPGLTELDPVTLAVIQNGLQQVCNEMDLAFVRAAFSPVISEALDRSDGIYHRDSGELVAQGELGLPVFVGTMQFSTQAVAGAASGIRSAARRTWWPATSRRATTLATRRMRGSASS